MQISSKWLVGALLGATMLVAREAWAARPAETLLPANTAGLLSFPSPSGLEQHFRQSHYSALLDDSRLADLAGEFRKSTGDFRQEIQDRLALDWNSLVACTAGELALAVVRPAGPKGALVLIADVTGREPQAQAQLAVQREKLLAAGATPADATLAGQTVQVYHPKASTPPEASAGDKVHALRDGLLLAAESLEAMQMLLDGWDRKPDDQLAQAPAYQSVMIRAQALMGTREAQLRVYYVPLAWAEATAQPKPEAAEADEASLDNRTIMRRQGLAGLQGVGGLLSFTAGEYDSFIALAIHAPPPYEKAMRLLDFPGPAATGAAAWVPKDVGSHCTLSWNLKDVWQYYGPLYDDTSADGTKGAFNDMLDGLRDDPDGPQIDARKDFFPKLSDQVTVVSGPPSAEKPDQASTLYVVATTADLAPLLKRFYEGDPDVRKLDWQGHVIWEIVAPKEEAASDTPLNFISAASFSNNRLFLSTDVKLLQNALAPHAANELLDAAPEFRDAQKRLEAIQAGAPFLRQFSWPEYAVRDMQRLLNLPRAKGDSKSSIAAPEVPDAAVERQHLGAMALRMDRIENGWTLTGFTLRNQPR